MLLIKTALELSERPTQYIDIVRMLCGGTAPVALQPTGEFQNSIQICGESKDVIPVRTEQGLCPEFSYAITEGSRFRLCVAFQECWKRVPAKCTGWERKYLTAERTTNAPTNATRPRKGGAGEDWIFDGVSIRYYIQSISNGTEGNIHLWIRCEWPAYRYETRLNEDLDESISELERIKSLVIFDGVNAAHPHFHFEAIPLSAIAARDLLGVVQSNADGNSFMAEVDGAGFNPYADGVVPSHQIDMHHLHLPTVADWRTTTFIDKSFGKGFRRASAPLAHQSYPKSVQEIDNWVGWSLHYFKDQFEKYIMGC